MTEGQNLSGQKFSGQKLSGQMVFGLDIGTRSIVGTVGYKDKSGDRV